MARAYQNFLMFMGTLACLAAMLWVVDLATTVRAHEVKTWTQPASVVYDGDTYALSVSARPLSRLNPFADPAHDIFVGRAASKGSYGHFLSLSLPATFEHAGDELFASSTVEWTKEGVWLRTPTKHQLFIPAKAFLGGR